MVDVSRDGGDQLSELLNDDEKWSEILQEKGGQKRLKVIKRNLDFGRGMSQDLMMQMLMGRGPSAEVFFLDNDLPDKLDYDELSKNADETISLKGLDKDDIRDMLSTLL